MDFEVTIEYIAGQHSQKRFRQRKDLVEIIADEYLGITVKESVQRLAEKGSIFLDLGNRRYIRNGDFYLPCVKVINSPNKIVYKITSLLTWSMVEKRLQNILYKYLDC